MGYLFGTGNFSFLAHVFILTAPYNYLPLSPLLKHTQRNLTRRNAILRVCV